MANTLRPETTGELRDAVAWAVSEETPLELVGAGTKRGIGRAMQTSATLDLSAFSGISLYEPAELVLSAGAGTCLGEVQAKLAAKAQDFAFEPPDFSRLLGSAHAGTLGGMIAANLAGPRRIKSGAARDHFLGFKAVSGRGEEFKAGGRVMKNVTGYDLPKLMAGSWGTLAVLTEVTFKVLPAAETVATLIIPGLDDETAVRAMSIAMGSAADVSGAAHLPAGIAAASRIEAVRTLGKPATLLRLEGIRPSVAFRFERLAGLLANFGAAERLDSAESRMVWTEVRDVHYLCERYDRLVWRLSVPPTDGPRVLDTILQNWDARGFYDWAGGLIWVEVPPSSDGSAETVRAAIAPGAGHATLIRAPGSLRASIDVFQPQPAALAAVTRRIKAGFDPKGILNPGRMYP